MPLFYFALLLLRGTRLLPGLLFRFGCGFFRRGGWFQYAVNEARAIREGRYGRALELAATAVPWLKPT